MYESTPMEIAATINLNKIGIIMLFIFFRGKILPNDQKSFEY